VLCRPTAGLPGRRVAFSIVNFAKARSLYKDGMTPLVWSASRPWWERLPQRQVLYYRSAKHRNAYVLTWVFQFDQARTPAPCLPAPCLALHARAALLTLAGTRYAASP